MGAFKLTGGQTAKRGHYWNFSNGERVYIEKEGILPGGDSDSYYRFPPLVAFVAAPFLGLLYAVFLPFIGIAMMLSVLGRRLFGGLFESAGKSAAFSWKPSESYFLGRKKKKKAEKGKNKDA